MSRPPKRMRPASGLSSPLSWPIKVVLPAPFGPMTAWSSPVGTASVISSDASTPPKRLLKPSISRRASVTAQSLQQAVDPTTREEDNEQEQRAQHDLPVFCRPYSHVMLHEER